MYRNKQTKALVELTHTANERGICQVYDPTTNQVYFVFADQLEPAFEDNTEVCEKVKRLIERNRLIRQIYKEGTRFA